jgi:hypothetical protein
MFVRDWPELLSEISDLEAPEDVTPYVMARINAAHADPAGSPKRRSAGFRGRLTLLPTGWFAAAAGGLIVLGLLALAAHSREHRGPVGASPRLAHYRGDGVEFSYPAAWHYRHRGVYTLETSPVIDLSTQPMGDPCHGQLGCGWPVNRHRPGGVVLTVISGGQLLRPTTTKRTIREYRGDRLDPLSSSIGCDRLLVGDYATPTFGHFSFSACFRAPGLAVHEREFRAMLDSVRLSNADATTKLATLKPATFTRSKGWHVGSSSHPGTPGEQTFTWAATTHFHDAPFSAPPAKTLKAMSPDDLLVGVFLTRPSKSDHGGTISSPALPIHLDGSAPSQDYPGASGSRWFQRFQGAVGDRQLDVWVFAGRTQPTAAQIAKAQSLINSMVLPKWSPPSN